MPTVPEYYRAYIDPNVDLTEVPKQCCPFHKEDTPSFSYDMRTGKWSCFGACHAYGKDVIDMHMRKFRMSSREQAERDLAIKCGVRAETLTLKQEDIFINPKVTDTKAMIAKLCLFANTPRRWVQLDKVMETIPVNPDDLYNLLIEWDIR